MKVLFITGSGEDYLADSLLHGFRSLLGADVVDYPKAEILYRNCPSAVSRQVRGNGFTLYGGLLDDLPVDRYDIPSKLDRGYFDLVVFSDIWRQYGLFTQFRPALAAGRTVICDGADTALPYPCAGRWWRRPYYWFLPRAHRQFLYFKREWTPATQFNAWHRLLPPAMRSSLPAASNLRPVSFSIPEEKIVATRPVKTKLLPRHIVDAEVRMRADGSEGYAFTREADYFADLQASRFGVTTKRGGWDCLRHYEIAANGAVPCFRNLDQKPVTCAPHGLHAGNCISYRSADELFARIEKMPEMEYVPLQAGALAWVRENTTVVAARRIIEAWQSVRG